MASSPSDKNSSAGDKPSLRRRIRHARRSLSMAQQLSAASQAAALLSLQPEWQQIGQLAAYLANDGELDPAPLLARQWQQGRRSCLPRLHPFRRGYLLFQHYDAGTRLITNRLGIAEPALDVRTVVPIRQLDAILLPLVAFDRQGSRLGMGGGFYDRTLAGLSYHRQPADSQPLLIGYAHDLQQVDNLPTEPWDHPLDLVITPSQVLRFP